MVNCLTILCHVIQEQQTALHIAARLGDVEGARLLLSNGADCNLLTRDHYTPLHIAVKDGHDDVIKLLLDYGAKQSIRTKVNNVQYSL